MHRRGLPVVVATLATLIAACGSGSSEGVARPQPPAPPTITRSEAFRFLNQATFGATEAEAQRVIAMGFEAWIDDQFAQPPSLQLPHLLGLPRPQFLIELQPDRVDIWFRNALHGPDQLRQRVAFALSEIMVVSQLGVLGNMTYSLASYYDLLARNAFGNYRDLIEEVTLHPAMGIYLSMLGNEKPDPIRNIRPDENYARELMQLFSIGLVQLNEDGTILYDGDGTAVPTYDQSVIEGFAHVYTGWTFAGARDFRNAVPTDLNQVRPMQLYPEFHDTGPKKLLDGIELPPAQGGGKDLQDALDNVFKHPNVGPFISVRLIQRLVTSNPSPRYVSRVAAVFDDNGAGVRGDLGAVVRAILLDDEARPEPGMELDGKLKEPLLRLTQLWRAYGARSASGRYPLVASYVLLGQGPLQSPSVFNFFSAFYAPPGEIRDSGLVAPELEIATEFQNTWVTNFMFFQTFVLNWQADPGADPDDDIDPDSVLIRFQEELDIAADRDALINRVSEKLLGGEISDALRNEISMILADIPIDQGLLRAAETIYMVVSSPEYAYQR